MIRLMRWAGSTLASILAVYTFFFVPIGGSRTLWEHTRRIAATSEAQDLGHDVDRAGREAARRLAQETFHPVQDASVDGGVPKVRRGVLEPPAVRPRFAPGAHLPR